MGIGDRDRNRDDWEWDRDEIGMIGIGDDRNRRCEKGYESFALLPPLWPLAQCPKAKPKPKP